MIYLKAEPQDPMLQQEKLTCDFFLAMGLPVSQAEFVNVQLNGSYQGIYLDIEPIRSPFKKRAGLDPNGTLIRAATFQHLDWKAPGELSGKDGSLAELQDFIRQLKPN